MYHLPEVTWLTFLYTGNEEEILTCGTTKPTREGLESTLGGKLRAFQFDKGGGHDPAWAVTYLQRMR